MPRQCPAARQRPRERTDQVDPKDQPIRMTVTDHTFAITVNAAAVADALGLLHPPDDPASVDFEATDRLRRLGHVMRLIEGSGATVTPTPNASPINLIVQARRSWAALRSERITLGTLVVRDGMTSSWATRVLRLTFLSPQLVEVIVTGRQ